MNKLSVKYYIQKRGDSRKEVGEDFRLLMSLHFNGKRIIHYPGLYFFKHQWDKEYQLVQNRLDSEKLNVFLNTLRKEADRLYHEWEAKSDHVEINQFRERLREIKVSQAYSLSQALIYFIEDQYIDWSRATYLKFKTLYKKLSDYESTFNLNLSLESADSEFLRNFDEFLINANLQASTIHTYLNNIKWFLNYCYKNKWMINRDYLSFKESTQISPLKEEKDINYLKFSDLEILCESEIDNRKYEQCRDIFCFIAYTGIRFSEVNSLKKESLRNGKLYIEGRRSRVINLNSFALEIVKKYQNKYFSSGTIFPRYSIITVNKYLNLVFDDLKIYPVSELVNTDYKVSIALAYNSFMANTIRFGISPVIVRKWSANNTLSRYSAVKNSIEEEEYRSVEIMNNHYEQKD